MLVGRLRFEREWALTVFWSALGVEVGKAMSWIGVGVVGWGLVTMKSSFPNATLKLLYTEYLPTPIVMAMGVILHLDLGLLDFYIY